MSQSHETTGFADVLEAECRADDAFRREWLRLAPARQFAAMLVGYRADHGLTQRQLAKVLGVSQPRVARLESGERNPDIETIIAIVEKLGTEFVIHVGPAGRRPRLVTKRAQTSGARVEDGELALVTAAG